MSMSFIVRPCRLSSFGTAKTGPMPISSGRQPATAKPRKTPSGSMPSALARHENRRRGAVGELRRVPRRHRAVLFERRLQLGEPLERRVRTIALVLRDVDLLEREVAVGALHRLLHVHRDDVVLELA